ncbi:sialidase family protein [Marinobacterium rhizophilum]|uniref:sialidase family protein n=1 Tax=Marinobacterium rhizophilum TaxID=420402 RepID=UPI00037633BC|nr:sialidase family protein [Marinobacterium rhizophilum]
MTSLQDNNNTLSDTSIEYIAELPYADIPSLYPQNHAANLLPLGNGDLLCVWFGGTQEGMSDISVMMSRLPAGTMVWDAPIQLSDDPTRSEQNPILFRAPDARLWLLYTAQKSGNQDTSIVRRRISDNDGQTWGPVEDLFTQPGTFVREPPVILENGDLLLPLFYCCTQPGEKWVGNNDISAVKISTDGGLSWSEVEVPNSVGCVHMGIQQLNDGSLIALYRSRWADWIYCSRSEDNGRTWSEPEPTELPNNNSSIQFVKLHNGHLALVYNHSQADEQTERRVSLYDEIEDEDDSATLPDLANMQQRSAFWGTPRAPMSIALSSDGGRSWQYKRDIMRGDGYCMTNNSERKLNREFSYPSVTQAADGRIHVAFTYHRQFIRHFVLDEAWIKQTGN